MSGRAAIAMSAGEALAFLREEDILTCATVGRDGWPHLMPLWYVVRAARAGAGAGIEGECWAWTYAKSQKVRNLERDPRCTIQVEAGEAYQDLRGVMLKAECAIEREPGAVAAVGEEIAARHAPITDAIRAELGRQARKRVALRFAVREAATWDHRKL